MDTSHSNMDGNNFHVQSYTQERKLETSGKGIEKIRLVQNRYWIIKEVDINQGRRSLQKIVHTISGHWPIGNDTIIMGIPPVSVVFCVKCQQIRLVLFTTGARCLSVIRIKYLGSYIWQDLGNV